MEAFTSASSRGRWVTSGRAEAYLSLCSPFFVWLLTCQREEDACTILQKAANEVKCFENPLILCLEPGRCCPIEILNYFFFRFIFFLQNFQHFLKLSVHRLSGSVERARSNIVKTPLIYLETPTIHVRPSRLLQDQSILLRGKRRELRPRFCCD